MAILKYIHLSYLFCVFLLLCLLFSLFFWICSISSALNPVLNYLRERWSYLFFYLSFIFPLIKGRKNIKKHKQYIICINHNSYLDIPLAVICAKKINHRYAIVAKNELKKIIVFNPFFIKLDILIKRHSPKHSLQALEEAERKLKKGYSIIMFPEGTIGKDKSGKIKAFKQGAFQLAIKTKVPILPITFTNTWKIMFGAGLKNGSRPGICPAIIHSPIITETYQQEDVSKLRNAVFTAIQSAL